jgi:surface carbohydrate biosynthesis protein
MPKFNDILLPVETSSRELDAKLLLALFAAEAGFRCHIGPMERIRNPSYPPSIYVSKSVRFAKPVQLMSGFGHVVVAWDEEGLVRFSDEIHAKRIEAAALQTPRLLLSWGSSNTRLWKNHPFYQGCPIADTGNPRIDLLRPELRSLHQQKCEEIQARYGDFALLNTNFSMVNHFKPGGRRTRVKSNSFDCEAFIEYRQGLEEHKRKLFKAFLSALPALAEQIRPCPLVVRPHPSEDPKPWRHASDGISNISVVHEGSVVPWLLAAKCLIHNGCTSAVEASVLKIPALAFCPVVDHAYDIALPNDLSEKYYDREALTDRVRELISANHAERAMGRKDLLRDHIASLDGPLACERIVATFLKLQDGNLPAPFLHEKIRSHATYAWKLALRTLSASRRRYQDHKSRPEEFARPEIGRRIAAFSQALGRFGNVIQAELSPGVITLNRFS